jgi:DNA-binding transcriptional regulator YdaS (Cro superfamily)
MVIFAPMDLKTYLETLTMKEREDFAKRCKSTAGHLRNVSYGYRSCAESLAISIEKESGGKVRCETLRPDVDWQFLRNTA